MRKTLLVLTGIASAAIFALSPLTPAQADTTAIQATWSCNGIPAGYVSLSIDPYQCGGTYPGHLISAPESGQWICGWNGNAMNSFVVRAPRRTRRAAISTPPG